MGRRLITFFTFWALFTASIGLSGNTNASFEKQIQTSTLATNSSIEYTRLAEGEEELITNDLGITLHPGTEYKPESNGSPRSLSHCKSLVYRTLKSLPAKPVEKLKNLTLYFSDTGLRGLGGGDTIILRCQNVADEELVAVLTHVIGHIMDTGVMKGYWPAEESPFRDGANPVRNNDSSLDFYSISFKDSKGVKDKATKYDFVSGYAMTDPFEDFAESYAYYILHGTEFKELTKQNDSLKQKYYFLKTQVFEGIEYDTGNKSAVNARVRHYDVTVLPYSMDKFLVR